MKTNIFIAGDIVNSKNETSFIHDNLQQIIKDNDFAICNFEAPVKGEGEKCTKVGSNLSQKKETL